MCHSSAGYISRYAFAGDVLQVADWCPGGAAVDALVADSIARLIRRARLVQHGYGMAWGTARRRQGKEGAGAKDANRRSAMVAGKAAAASVSAPNGSKQCRKDCVECTRACGDVDGRVGGISCFMCATTDIQRKGKKNAVAAEVGDVAVRVENRSFAVCAVRVHARKCRGSGAGWWLVVGRVDATHTEFWVRSAQWHPMSQSVRLGDLSGRCKVRLPQGALYRREHARW